MNTRKAVAALVAALSCPAMVMGDAQTFDVVTLASPNEECCEGEFGRSVADAGDVNGDGVSDVIVGAPEEETEFGTGRAYVFSGSDDTLLLQLEAPNTDPNGEGFGFSVAAAGDVNQDGYGDVIVGAWLEAFQEGRAYVFAGPGGNLLFQLRSPNGPRSQNFGRSVAAAGDANQDGIPDFVIGAPLESPLGSPQWCGRSADETGPCSPSSLHRTRRPAASPASRSPRLAT